MASAMARVTACTVSPVRSEKIGSSRNSAEKAPGDPGTVSLFIFIGDVACSGCVRHDSRLRWNGADIYPGTVGCCFVAYAVHAAHDERGARSACQCAIQREHQTMRPTFGPVRIAHTLFAVHTTSWLWLYVEPDIAEYSHMLNTHNRQMKSHSPSGGKVRKGLWLFMLFCAHPVLSAACICSHFLLHTPWQCANYVRHKLIPMDHQLSAKHCRWHFIDHQMGSHEALTIQLHTCKQSHHLQADEHKLINPATNNRC